jgi:Mg2+/Co2+ transporter CorB
MVPRNEVVGINLEASWEDIVARLTSSKYKRLLVYRDNIDQVVGFLHLREVLNLIAQKPQFGRQDLETLICEPYFYSRRDFPEYATPQLPETRPAVRSSRG